MAIKDVFKGFFIVDDEEEVYEEPRQEQSRAPEQEQSSQEKKKTAQNTLKSVPSQQNNTTSITHAANLALNGIFFKRSSKNGAMMYIPAQPAKPNINAPSRHILPLMLQKYPV